MAKDKGGFDSFINPQLLNKKQSKAAERYGIDPQDYGFSRPGHGSQKKDPREFSKDVASAAMSDYDTRRTMEAAAMSGHSKAEKYAKGGFESLEDVTKANNIMRRMHGKAGNGGDFSSASDFAGVTYDQVNKDRDNMMSGIDNQFSDLTTAQEELRNKQESMSAASASAEPYEPSERAKAALGETEFKPIDRGLGDQSLAYDPNAGIQDKDAGEFLNNYKQDIQSGVKKSGAQPRGMMSIHNRF